MDAPVLLGRDDPTWSGRRWRRLDSLAWVQEDDLVVERCGEDRVQHGLAFHDRRWSDAGWVLETGDPLSDIDGQDLGHPQITQLGQQVPVEDVPVTLSGGGLDDVIREPLVLNVGPQSLAAPAGIAHPAGCERRLGALPGALGLALARERSR